MASVELVLPRLIGSRDAARTLMAELKEMHGKTVVLNARDLRSATPSAADEFVKVALLAGGASTLEVVGAGESFVRDLEASARDREVASKLRQMSAS